MPLIEYLVHSPAELASPGGLTSPGWSLTKEAEQAAWKQATPDLWNEIRRGRYIMVMVFSRENKGTTSSWDEGLNNFRLDPKMDAIIAAYSLDANVGCPYKPGTCIEMFAKATMVASQTGKTASELRARRVSESAYIAFQMPSDTSPVKFQEVGVMGMIRGLERGGKTFAEVSVEMSKSYMNKEKWGWKGGPFPQVVNRPPHRMGL